MSRFDRNRLRTCFVPKEKKSEGELLKKSASIIYSESATFKSLKIFCELLSNNFY